MSWISSWFGNKASWTRPRGDDRFYLDLNGQKLPCKAEFEAQCVDLDVDCDRLITDQEFEYLAQNVPFKVDPKRWIEEHKHAFTHTPLTQELALYPDAQGVERALDQIARAHPQTQKVSLGKTHQGRDIWALRMGNPEAPGVVITGGTHAREWGSVALPLALADRLANDPQRLQNGQHWIVPLVNPDGYEISRAGDSTHRTNARGVDLNRNFWDGRPETATLYRPQGDTPERTADDTGASDRPTSRTYRGPHGASEPETRALQNLELQPQIVAVLDHHNCGELLLGTPATRPLAEAMNRHLKTYKIQNPEELYAVSGHSGGMLAANGIAAITMESGLSMQPPEAELKKLLEVGVPAQLAFIDEAVTRSRQSGARQGLSFARFTQEEAIPS